MGLFMRPIVPPAPVHSVIRLVGAGGYRMLLACQVIGAILITLGVIGLAGSMVIRTPKNFDNSLGRDGIQTQTNKNNSKDYYPGVHRGDLSYPGP